MRARVIIEWDERFIRIIGGDFESRSGSTIKDSDLIPFSQKEYNYRDMDSRLAPGCELVVVGYTMHVTPLHQTRHKSRSLDRETGSRHQNFLLINVVCVK